ncbi:MAG: hypothetical protein ACPG5W_12475, partial [Flavobacteriales bacterium]
MRSLAHLNQYFWRYKTRFFLGILFVTISNFYAVVPPKVVRITFDLIRELSIIAPHFRDTPISVIGNEGIIGVWFFFGGVIVLSMICKGIFMFFMRQMQGGGGGGRG